MFEFIKYIMSYSFLKSNAPFFPVRGIIAKISVIISLSISVKLLLYTFKEIIDYLLKLRVLKAPRKVRFAQKNSCGKKKERLGRRIRRIRIAC